MAQGNGADDQRQDFTHLSPGGRAGMVDVSAKQVTRRTAWVQVGAGIAERLQEAGGPAKGNVLETARPWRLWRSRRARKSRKRGRRKREERYNVNSNRPAA